MVNVGLRAYIWQQKSLEQQTARELWSLNDATYEGYRQYVRSGLCLAAVEPLTGAYIITFLYRCSHCKEVGFPAQKALQISRRPSSAGKHAGQASASSLASTSSQAPTPFIFTGLSGNTSACTSDTSVSKPTRSDYFQAADTAFRAAYVRATCHWSKGTLYYGGTHQKYHDHVGVSEARVTVLKFGRQSSDLLAYGCQDGSVQVVNLEEAGDTDHVLRQHKQAIIDLDWSLDDTLLLCVALDGNISMWLTASAQLLRTFRTASTACCARFHMVNQNLMLAGTKSGVVQVFNCSTGKMIMKQMVCDSRAFSASINCVAMALSNYHLFVADSKGIIHTLRCDIKNGMLLSLVLLSRTAPPGGSPVHPASLVYSPFSSLARGPALLTSSLEGQLRLLKLMDAATGLLEVTSMVNLPRAARKICATFCPKLHISEPEYVVAGGEDTNVYIFDISRPSSKPIVVNQLQGHNAPVVDVSWSPDESLLASSDCDGAVIVWKRE